MNKNQKRRLYKDNASTTLNEDGTVKTFQQKVEEINAVVAKMLQAIEHDKRLRNQK